MSGSNSDSNWYDGISDFFYGDDGSFDFDKLLSLGEAGVGLAGILGIGGDAFKAQQSGFSGYQGSIPKYTATRTRLPQDPNAPAGMGRRYFSDVTFEKQPEENEATNSGGITDAIGDQTQQFARGGVAALAEQGRYLAGDTDGMADKIETTIDGTEEARLSHGEFVIPADVVSHLGNGNSEAGAQVLYDMMDKIRMARTGNKKQGKEINPEKMLPKRGMA